MIRPPQPALAPLITLLASMPAVILLAALPAAALSPVSLGAESHDSNAAVSFPGAETLCDGECSGLPPLAVPLAQADPFDFELGLRVFEQGLDLTIASGGNVYVVGPVDATERVALRAAQVVVFDFGTAFAGNDLSIEIETPGQGTDLMPRIIDFPDIIALPRDGEWPVCGCITLDPETVVLEPGSIVGGAGGSLELRAGGGSGLRLERAGVVVAAQAVAGGSSSSPLPIGALSISRTGDVYLDLSGVTLRSLDVEAKGAIVFAGGDVAAVPEPGTALLLGFGLAVLARGGAGARR